VPFVGAKGAMNCSSFLIFILIRPAKGASKYLHDWVRVPQTKKGYDHIKMDEYHNSTFITTATANNNNTV